MYIHVKTVGVSRMCILAEPLCKGVDVFVLLG